MPFNVRSGERVIDFLTDERRVAARNPKAGEMLDALKDTQNVAEEMLYQGSMHNLFRDAWKIGAPLANLPMEVYLAIANLHPDWWTTPEGKKDFLRWLRAHPGYRYYRSTV